MSRGFSLIELLVVIAIIGMLTAIGLASYNEVRKRGRDARRMQDVQELHNALGLYTILNSTFPIAVASTPLTGADAVSSALVAADALPTIPLDPQYPTYTYDYQSDAGGSSYSITFCLETDTIPNYSAGCSNVSTP